MLQFNKTTKKLPYSIINKFAIGLDALSFQLKAPDRDKEFNKQHLLNILNFECKESYQSNGFTVKKEISNNPAYHIQFWIYYAKHRLATLYSNPTKGYGYSKHLRPLHVENSALYTMDFARLIPQFLEAFDLTVNNVSLLDLIIDNQQRNPYDIIQLLIQDSDNYQIVKLKNDAGFYGHGPIDIKSNSITGTVYKGNDDKKVITRIYNKTSELLEKEKPEINKWQRANGLTSEEDIWRTEVSVRTNAFATYKPLAVTEDGELTTLHRLDNNEFSKASKAVKITEKTKLDIDISRLNDKAYLVSLIERFSNIDIRRKDATRITNCTKVPLFDFSIYGKGELNTVVTQTINMSEKINEKKFIKHALETYKSTGSLAYLDIARDTAERNDLFADMAILIEALRIKESVKSFGFDYLMDNYATLQKHNLAAA